MSGTKPRVGRVLGLVWLSMWMGCGGQTGADKPSGASGGQHSQGDAGPAAIPMKDGVPIGDCVEPTAEQQAALGCPVAPPEFGSSCDVPATTACRYQIEMRWGETWQEYFRCGIGGRTWGNEERLCGQICGPGWPNVVEFSGQACNQRPMVDCETLLGWSDQPPAQECLNVLLSRAAEQCVGLVPNAHFELVVTDGCPVRLSSDTPLDAGAVACLIAELDGVRWDCATQLMCASYALVYT